MMCVLLQDLLCSWQGEWERLISGFRDFTDVWKSGPLTFHAKIAGQHAIPVVASRYGAYPARVLCDLYHDVCWGQTGRHFIRCSRKVTHNIDSCRHKQSGFGKWAFLSFWLVTWRWNGKSFDFSCLVTVTILIQLKYIHTIKGVEVKHHAFCT